MQRCKAAVNRDKRKSDALLPFSPLIEYENVNFRQQAFRRRKWIIKWYWKEVIPILGSKLASGFSNEAKKTKKEKVKIS